MRETVRLPEHGEMLAALGHYVRQTRLLLGWSQENLANDAQTSQGLISRLERGACLDLPFISIFKVLTALAPVVNDVDSAVPPPFRVVLACAELPQAPAVLPDPQLAALLQTYHTVPAVRRAAFVEMLRPLAALFAGQGFDAITEEPE